MEIVLIVMVVAFGGSMAYFFKQSQYLTQQMLIRTDVATNDFVKQLVDENLQTQEEVRKLTGEIKKFEAQIKNFTKEKERLQRLYEKSRTTIQKEVIKVQGMLNERNKFNESVAKDSQSIREHLHVIDSALKSHEALILNATRQNVGQTWYRS